MSSSKKKANGAKEKPTKYDITIKYTDKDMPFILEEMTHRSNKDINNNTGARLSKLINKEYENIATSEDILVSVNKTVVLKLSLPKIKRMFHELRLLQKRNHEPITCRFVNANVFNNKKKELSNKLKNAKKKSKGKYSNR